MQSNSLFVKLYDIVVQGYTGFKIWAHIMSCYSSCLACIILCNIVCPFWVGNEFQVTICPRVCLVFIMQCWLMLLYYYCNEFLIILQLKFSRD